MMKNIYLLFILLFTNAAFSQTVTVNSLADDGSSGTLRWAISQANGDAAIDKINFDSGLNGTITLTSNLPNISAGLTIEGPGTSVITISGNNAYQMFTVNQSVTLTISGLAFTKCATSAFQTGSMFYAAKSTVIADNILVTANTRSTPFYAKDNGSLISITNSTFSNNSATLFGSDYGNTPSTTDPDENYTNRIMVKNSTFTGNSGVIFSTERFVKIDGCTFNNNTNQIGNFKGLNRYQVINSTFNNNTGSTLFSFSSTLSTGTFFATLSDNHHLFDSNTFSGNTRTIINPGSSNEQQRTTITNNTFTTNGTNWTGSPKVVSSNKLDNFVSSVSHNLANSTVTVNMSKAVYGGLNSTGAIDVNDFEFSLTGGNATLASTTPSSISASGNSYTLGLRVNGYISGSETLKVIPVVNSIYDSGNNIAATSQKNNSVQLNPNSAPSAISLTASGVAENASTGTVIGTLSSTDADAGETHTYSLVSGTGDTNNSGFEISGSNLKTKEVFNFETKSSYSIRIRSTDNLGLTYDKVFTITVSNVNEIPTAIALSSTSITENSASGTVVGTLSSTDPDAGDTFSYTLVSGTGDTDNSSFELSGNQLKVKEVFNFESKSSYSIRVRSTDSGNLNFEQSFTITVSNVNEVPSAITLSSTSITENSASGTVVGTLSSTDPDAGDTFSYTLVSGTGDTDNSSFELSGNQLKVKEVFNFESKSSYSIRIRNTDSGNLNFEQTFTITVNNANEAPTAIAMSSTSISENSSIGTAVGTLSSTDADAGDTFSYSLVSGTGDTDNSKFELSGNQLKVKEVFNFESKSSYSIRIRNTDSGNLSYEQTFTITVNNVNESPSAIALSSTSITENSAPGTVVGTLSSTDPDAEDTFSYTLVSGTGDTDNSSFELSGNQLRVKEVFNFESKSSYSIRVRNTDSGNLNYEQTFTITVNNVNESPSAIALSSTSITENSAPGTVVGSLSSMDTDVADTHTYTLVSGAGDVDNASFTIRGNEILTKKSFDYEIIKSLNVRVRSTDSGQNWVEASMRIEVLNVNEAPVKLIINAGHISENDSIGAKVGILKVTDPDDGDIHAFSFISGLGDSDNHKFSIKDNLLLSKDVFDYEKRNTYSIRVKVSDAGGLDYEEILSVNIIDVNEQPSAIIMTKGNVYEANKVGETVGILKTDDQDSGDTHNFSLVNGSGPNDNSEFIIVGNQIQALKVYKFSEKNVYRLRVRSTDKGGLFLDAEFKVTISQIPLLTGTGTEPYSGNPTAASPNPKISKGSVSKLSVQGTDIMTYKWTPSYGLSSTAVANPEASPQQTTTYTVELMNRFGSSTKASITIEVMDDFKVKPGNIMTPNGDGENDSWIVENLQNYPNNELTIFSSDGKIIYRRKGYENDWNAQLNGSDLPTGTYYYILTFNGGKGVKKGSITIVK